MHEISLAIRDLIHSIKSEIAIERRTLQLASNLGVSDPQLKPRLTHMPLTYVKAIKTLALLSSAGMYKLLRKESVQALFP